MTLAEAIRALNEGKPIRRIPWEWEIYSQYIRLNKDGQLVNEKGDPVLLFFDSADFKTDNWEIVHKPVLNDDEKTLLENIVRPFRKRFEHITIVKETLKDNFVLTVHFYNKDEEYYTYLPHFSKKDDLYAGMEADKIYSTAELGLFVREA